MRRSSVFEDISNEIVILIETRQVVVSAAFDPDQGDAIGVDAL